MGLHPAGGNRAHVPSLLAWQPGAHQSAASLRAAPDKAFPIEGRTGMTVLEDDTWNAGDMGCGELVLELRLRLLAMPGRVLKLIATDAGAPEDIPAYCRMTRHELVHVAAPAYWIRARTPSA